MTISAPFALDCLLVPDEDCWGPGYGGRGYPSETLDEIAGYLAETTQPGYRARLLATSPGYVPAGRGGPARVPAGFDATGHPNRATARGEADPEIATVEAAHPPVRVHPGLRDHLRARGWALDQHGRPLHPHHVQLLADPRIGLPTGLGYAWWWGETAVVDTVVTTDTGHVLLIPRTTDQGVIPSLPGGYALPGDEHRTTAQWRGGDRALTIDGIAAAGARTLRAETGLALPAGTPARIVRAIRPVSSPHTLHAWTCTYTTHAHLPGTPPALDPATGAWWCDVDGLHRDGIEDRMWPDHRRALAAAIE
ncbi:NUDIX hydrolase [Actinokineospora sp. NBRC 105648]|uniref:NUDIX hydrolase n=1 Tax=Actinokineospora sp. NBRC 105648 TaxID=3032206 RepID=UPI0024A1AF31|nr:NUDIX hydrolase [Actinokineospora sp. NBRC 105648]GLZ43529.1 hypothetical protein Acsp05_71530 [Actinokineospora sp. NBRC 105648]